MTARRERRRGCMPRVRTTTARADPEGRVKYDKRTTSDKEHFWIKKKDCIFSPRAHNWRGKSVMRDLNMPRRNWNGIIWVSQEKWYKIWDNYLRMRVGELLKEISHRQVPAHPEPKAKYDQVYLDKLNQSRPGPQNIHECKVHKEEVPNKYSDEEVLEPQVEIQHSQETAKEVIYFERIPDAVREDTTGGCQHAEVKSLVKEY